MICTSNEYHVETYVGYKNRTRERYINKVKNTVQQIKDCSLKPEDKLKLKQELIKLLS